MLARVLPLVIVLGTVVPARLPYIIGGREAEPGAWPWQGSIRRYGSHNCGCSLVSATWAVTAAHCLTEDNQIYKFQFGSTDRLTGGIVVSASRIVVHPGYEVGEGSHPNDIALVQFESPINGTNIGVVPMADTDSDYTDKACWITGWGYTIPGAGAIILPRKLQQAPVATLTEEDCRDVWGDKLNPAHVCAGDKNEKRTSCGGDSGGPLVCMADSGEYELAGVTSWGVVFCWPSMPSVYTRVAYFRQWIDSVINV